MVFSKVVAVDTLFR